MAVHHRETLRICWQCLNVTEAHTRFCNECNSIQPVTAADPFEVLGLPPIFQVNPVELERNYILSLSQVHPDRFTHASARARLYAQQQAALVNDSYRILKDTYERTLVLLKMRFPEVTFVDKDPPELLCEIFEWREKLERASSVEAKQRCAIDLAQQQKQIEQEMAIAFEREEGDELFKHMRRYRYMTKMMAELRTVQDMPLRAH